MKIIEGLRIEESGNGFSLFEEYDGKDKKGNPVKREKVYYYGNLYQALQGLLVMASQKGIDLYDVGLNISSILHSLDLAKEEIKRNFRTEVKTIK